MHNLPGVVGVQRIHAITPLSINTEPGGLSWEYLPTLHDFTFTQLLKITKLLVIALYSYLWLPYIMLHFLPSPFTKGNEKLVNRDIKTYPPHIDMDRRILRQFTLSQITNELFTIVEYNNQKYSINSNNNIDKYIQNTYIHNVQGRCPIYTWSICINHITTIYTWIISKYIESLLKVTVPTSVSVWCFQSVTTLVHSACCG